MAGKVAAVVFSTLLFISGLTAQSYSKSQFFKRVNETASAIKKVTKTYKSIENEVRLQFPDGTRKSPLYFAIRDDFLEYRKIMKRLNGHNISINKNSDKYSELFGGGLKGKKVISPEDEEFPQAKQLAGDLEQILAEALSDLARAAPLGNVHRTMLDKIIDIERFRDDLNGQIKIVNRDVERSSGKNEQMFRLFKERVTGMTDYGIFRNADSVRSNLLDAQQNLASRKDSLRFLLDQTQQLLTGIAKRGEKLRVWENFELISNERIRLTKRFDQGTSRVEELQEDLENLLKLGLAAQSYSKSQFSRRVNETASAIKKATKTYKSIEDEVKLQFPDGTRESPLYLAIRDDFLEYRKIMKRLNGYNISINKNSDKYSELFGGGLKGKIVISPEDEEFPQAKQLAGDLEQILAEALSDLARAAPLGNVHRTMLDKIIDIERFRDDLNGQIKIVNRDVERSSGENEQMFRLFKERVTGMTDYGIFRNADSVRTNLLDAQQNLASRKDSLRFLLDQTQQLLTGIAKRGEELRVWENFELISNERIRLTKRFDQGTSRVEELREDLENLLKLISEFGDILSEMDKDMVLLEKSYQNAMQSLKKDSLRYSSLMEKVPRGYTQEKPPYRELRATFGEAEATVRTAEITLKSMIKWRIDFIDHVSEMEGLKTDPGKYDRFKALNINFQDDYKTGKKTLKELDDAINAFREVIIEHFINTPEYWELLYKVEYDKSFGGNETVAENYGYLFDPNELPPKAYQGLMISSFQLKLVKTRERGQQSWSHHLVFSGDHDFPLKGFLLRSLDGVILVKADRDSITVEEEISKEDMIQFEWEIPVSLKQLGKMIKESELTLRVHLLTVTHRVNLTMYREKMFRDYLIPDERKQMWERIFRTK